MNLLYWRDGSTYLSIYLTRWCRFHLASPFTFRSLVVVLFCSFCFVWFSFRCFMYYCPAGIALKWSIGCDKMCNYNVANCGHPFWEVRNVDTLLSPSLPFQCWESSIFIDSFVFAPCASSLTSSQCALLTAVLLMMEFLFSFPLSHSRSLFLSFGFLVVRRIGAVAEL